MKLIKIKTPFDLVFRDKTLKAVQEYSFKKGDVYIMSDWIAKNFTDNFLKGISKFNKVKNISNVINRVMKISNLEQEIEPYNLQKHSKIKKITPVFIRTGGIGDLIALSSLTKYLSQYHQQIIWITQDKYKEVFKYYDLDNTDTKLIVKSFFEPIINTKKAISPVAPLKKLKAVFFEGIIERSKDNWYKLQFERVNAPFDATTYGRPHLRIPEQYVDATANIPLHHQTDILTILFNPKATSRIRTIQERPLLRSLINFIENDLRIPKAGYKIFIHERNLVDKTIVDDKDFKDRIEIIQSETLQGFLFDAKNADIAISTDTALIHFREGIKKPALAFYSSFPVYARTAYYQYTKTFDIDSPCIYQPCFIHTKKPNESCLIALELLKKGVFNEQDINYCPCMHEKYNKKLEEKYYNAFKASTDMFEQAITLKTKSN